MSFFKSAKSHLKAVKSYEPGKPIEEVRREYGLKHVIKMASNENALGPSPKALAAMRENLGKVHRYPDGGCFYLRRKLAKHLKVSPESLIFGNGSDEVLVFAVRALVGASDEVVIADPTFLIYEIASLAENARVIKVPMREFHYDLEAMNARINSKTKLIFIANPDNPVGTYIPRKALTRFLESVPRDVLVVLDEAYYEFARARKDYPRSLKLLGEFPNLLVTRTFSKAYGLSGLRIGYGIADPSVIAALNKVREPFNVNLLAQSAALAALGDKPHLKKTIRLVASGSAYLRAELRKMNIFTVDTVTNFVLADLGRPAGPVYEELLRRGIIVRPMSAWGLESFLRITVGRPAENKQLIEALKQIFQRSVQ